MGINDSINVIVSAVFLATSGVNTVYADSPTQIEVSLIQNPYFDPQSRTEVTTSLMQTAGLLSDAVDANAGEKSDWRLTNVALTLSLDGMISCFAHEVGHQSYNTAKIEGIKWAVFCPTPRNQISLITEKHSKLTARIYAGGVNQNTLLAQRLLENNIQLPDRRFDDALAYLINSWSNTIYYTATFVRHDFNIDSEPAEKDSYIDIVENREWDLEGYTHLLRLQGMEADANRMVVTNLLTTLMTLENYNALVAVVGYVGSGDNSYEALHLSGKGVEVYPPAFYHYLGKNGDFVDTVMPIKYGEMLVQLHYAISGDLFKKENELDLHRFEIELSDIPVVEDQVYLETRGVLDFADADAKGRALGGGIGLSLLDSLYSAFSVLYSRNDVLFNDVMRKGAIEPRMKLVGKF